MATYDLANGDTITKTPAEELAFDLNRAIAHDNAMATVMTEDLAAILALFREAESYIRRCASNDNEAHQLLLKMEGRQ